VTAVVLAHDGGILGAASRGDEFHALDSADEGVRTLMAATTRVTDAARTIGMMDLLR
jgi:hypothetical protein